MLLDQQAIVAGGNMLMAIEELVTSEAYYQLIVGQLYKLSANDIL